MPTSRSFNIQGGLDPQQRFRARTGRATRAAEVSNGRGRWEGSGSRGIVLTAESGVATRDSAFHVEENIVALLPAVRITHTGLDDSHAMARPLQGARHGCG